VFAFFGTCQVPKYNAFPENKKISCLVVFSYAMRGQPLTDQRGCRASSGPIISMARFEMVLHIGLH
jgi:hypothetical protein